MAQKNETNVVTSEIVAPQTTEVASLTCEDIDASDYKSVMKKFLGK